MLTTLIVTGVSAAVVGLWWVSTYNRFQALSEASYAKRRGKKHNDTSYY